MRLSDQLPAGTTFVSATAGCTVASGVLSCSLGTMASGAQQTVTLVVAVGAGLAGTTLVDAAQVASDTADPNPANNMATAMTPVRAAADVQLAMSAPASALAGGPLAYTLTVTNAGPDPAAAVALSDTLPTALGVAGGDDDRRQLHDRGRRALVRARDARRGRHRDGDRRGHARDERGGEHLQHRVGVVGDGRPEPGEQHRDGRDSVTPAIGCPAVGSVEANQDFTMVVGRKTRHRARRGERRLRPRPEDREGVPPPRDAARASTASRR